METSNLKEALTEIAKNRLKMNCLKTSKFSVPYKHIHIIRAKRIKYNIEVEIKKKGQSVFICLYMDGDNNALKMINCTSYALELIHDKYFL